MWAAVFGGFAVPVMIWAATVTTSPIANRTVAPSLRCRFLLIDGPVRFALAGRTSNRRAAVDPITTHALAEALGELMVDALKPVFARTARLAGLERPSFYHEYRQHLSSGQTRISVLSLYDALPPELNLVAIRDLLQAPIGMATVRQLSALHVLGEEGTHSSNSAQQHGWDKSQDRIHKAFIAYLTSALSAEYDLPAEPHVKSPNKQRHNNRLKLANAAFDLLDQYSAEAARYLTTTQSTHNRQCYGRKHF